MCSLTIDNPAASKNGSLLPRNTVLRTHLPAFITPNQMVHRMKCLEHQTCPQQSQSCQDPSIPGTHEALPNTYQSQPI